LTTSTAEKKDFTTNLRNERNPDEEKSLNRSTQRSRRRNNCFAIFVSGDYAIHQKSQNGVSVTFEKDKYPSISSKKPWRLFSPHVLVRKN
jgi:hypothetical protein